MKKKKKFQISWTSPFKSSLNEHLIFLRSRNFAPHEQINFTAAVFNKQQSPTTLANRIFCRYKLL